MASKIALIFILFLLLLPTVSAALDNGYKTTYTINVKDDGTAVWYVEYRTQLVTKGDFDAFENYTQQLKPVYLNEFRELMQKSVSAASNATKRKMMAGGFTGEASIETAPTGNYGVVRYSFTWTNFAKLDIDNNINVGDVFVGGLYLSKDNSLIIQFPRGYTAEQVTPQPDMIRDGMIWYGLRSFNSGEPDIVLLKPSISWMLYALIVIILAAGAFIFKIRRNKLQVTGEPSAEGTDTAVETLDEDASDMVNLPDIMDLEDRIVVLLKESGGSLYQSDIVKKLDLPKSTVSSALNGLHSKNTIQKIKKGRENLIRVTPSLDKV